MSQVCLYLQLHQPYRLNEVDLFALGQNQDYFHQLKSDKNREIFLKVAEKSYLPMLGLLLKLIKRHPGFTFALSCSGVFLEQAYFFAPEVIKLLKQLVGTGRVELLAETYYHSLASLYSPQEFTQQVRAHQRLVQSLFGVQPKVFRNTELIYSNEVVQQVAQLGFSGMLTEAVDRYLDDNTRTQLFLSASKPALPILLKHAQLSDDIAFRFSNRGWEEYPLTVERYLDWVEVHDENELVNLFMDFETFGEHQWQDTGIFKFFAEFVEQFLAKRTNSWVTPSRVVADFDKLQFSKVYDVPQPISWADTDRNLTAWLGNELQQDTIQKLYTLEDTIKASHDHELSHIWRLLQTSDHFYYMCTKWAADGDVHAYFSPYDSPYEAYRQYSIALAELQERLLDQATNSPRSITTEMELPNFSF